MSSLSLFVYESSAHVHVHVYDKRKIILAENLCVTKKINNKIQTIIIIQTTSELSYTL